MSASMATLLAAGEAANQTKRERLGRAMCEGHDVDPVTGESLFVLNQRGCLDPIDGQWWTWKWNLPWAKHCWEWEWSWDEDPDGVGVVIGMARRPGTRAEWMKWWRTGTSDGFHLELMQNEDPDDPEPDEHDPWGRWWYKWCEDCDRKECDGMSLQHFSEREYPADHPYLQTAAGGALRG